MKSDIDKTTDEIIEIENDIKGYNYPSDVENYDRQEQKEKKWRK